MPVFSALREFMPIRPEEKSTAPGQKAPLPRTTTTYTHIQGQGDDPADHTEEKKASISYSGPVSSPSFTSTPVHRELVGFTEDYKMNEGKINLKSTSLVPFYITSKVARRLLILLGNPSSIIILVL